MERKNTRMLGPLLEDRLKDVRHGPYEIWSMEQETGKPHSNPHRGINL